MCALWVLNIKVFKVKNMFCRMLGLCVHGWFYILQFLKNKEPDS